MNSKKNIKKTGDETGAEIWRRLTANIVVGSMPPLGLFRQSSKVFAGFPLADLMVLSKTFLDLIHEIRPNNGTEFCLKYLNDAFNGTGSNGLQLSEQTFAWQVWGVGILMVAIISFSSTLGILLLPFLSPMFYEHILTFFVTLGVGTLSGSAIFHLIPEAFELHNYVSNYLHKSAMIIAGVFLFHLVDKGLTIICDFKERSSIKPNAQPPITNKSNFAESSLPVQERQVSVSSHKSHISPVAWLVIFGDGLHNFIDGLSIGAAFNESFWDGISISVAVLCEEVPHELGDCAILINSGMSSKKALIYNLLSASTCFIGYVIGVLVGEMDRNFGQFIFALAGGMFLYISLAGMLPELDEKAEKLLKDNFRQGFGVILLQIAGLIIGVVIMYLFAEYGSFIQF